jgi:hypothetical protein
VEEVEPRARKGAIVTSFEKITCDVTVAQSDPACRDEAQEAASSARTIAAARAAPSRRFIAVTSVRGTQSVRV